MLPSDIAAEQSVLGSMLLSPWSAEQVLPLLTPSDLYRHEHQRIFRAIQAVAERGEGIDMVTVRSEMLREGSEQDPAILYLHDLINASVGRGNVVSQAQIILEHSTRRRLAIAAHEIAGQCQNLEMPLIDLVSSSESLLLDATIQNRAGDCYIPAASLLDEVIADMEVRSQQTGLPGISCGLSAWDNLTQGMERGGLYVFAGRPAMGKTGAAITIAAAACRRGLKVAFFSLEMPKKRLVERLLAGEGGISLRNIRSGQLTQEEAKALPAARHAISRYKLVIDDTSALSLPQIVSRCRRIRADLGGLDMVFVDYIGIMRPDSQRKAGTRAEEVSQIANGLKAAAKQLDVPVVALAQINRGVEGREMKKPMLSDLKESGGIEEAADVVTGLYRPCYYKPQEAQNQTGLEPAEWIVLKCRDGETGTAKVAFYGASTRFEDMEVSYDFEF
jgi:replicative DNA helicase